MKHAYSDGIKGRCIAVLGPLPPPLGGVSVHVERVIAKLKQHNRVFHFESCAEYRYRFLLLYLMRLTLFLLRMRPDALHLHTLYLSNGLAELAWIMRLQQMLGFEVMLIEHDCRYLYKKSDRWKAQLNRLLPHVTKQVMIGSLTVQSYKANTMASAQEVTLESAFLPPCTQDEALILATYPQELFDFMHEHSPLLLANAFQLSLLDGKDLYGLDKCLVALKELRVEYPTIGLVLALGQIGNQDYYDQLVKYVHDHTLQEHCYFVIGQRQLWPIIKKIDLFVRPTLSDGASVSIEEALWLGKPVVASNVCKRPDGVVLYDVGGVNGLCEAIKQAFGF